MHRRIAALALATCIAGVPAARAAVITVEADFVVIGGSSPLCELDEAIQSANEDFPIGGCEEGDGADVIRFDVDGDTITIEQELPAIEEALTIDGPGADQLVIDAEQTGRILTVAAGVTVTLQDLTLARGAAPAGNGGALLVQEGSNVTLRDCRFTGNEAANGGGVYVDEATLLVERCLFDSNVASAQGGGLHSRGGAVEVVNSTFSGNDADEGGGIAVVDAGSPGTTSLYSVTLAGNGADAGGNVLVANASELEARHVLFALASSGGNCDGAVTSLDWNLADDTSCGLTGDHDRSGTPAGIAALADNGGPTATHALQAGSVAIDGGDSDCRDAGGAVLQTDQRGPGFPRLTDAPGVPGAACDLGAYEAAPEPAGATAAALAALVALARRRRHRVP